MEDKKLNILFISSWYPNKYRPLWGIFVKRHAAAVALYCNVSAIFICSGERNTIEESVENNIYTIRGYYKKPTINVPLLSAIVRGICYILTWKKALLLYKSKKGKPDIINANIIYPVAIVAAWLKAVCGVPYIITEHWTGYFPEDGNYKGLAKKIVSRIAVANAGAVVAVSNKLNKTMQALGLRNAYFIIPNVVDTEQFKCKAPQTISQQPTAISFIHISSLDDEQKNVTGIIRTFKKFHTTHRLSKLTIIWDEDHKESINRIRLKESFSEDDGVFLESKKMGADLANLIGKADAFVLFSNYENLPVVMLESFCCGVPIIATNTGDIPEYVNERNGILIHPKNENELLNAMEDMLKNKANYNASEIRNMIVDKVSHVAVAKQFVDVYKIVLNRK